MRKKITAILMSFIMVLVAVHPLTFISKAVTSDEVTALGKANYNLADGNVNFWSFDNSWGGNCIALADGSLSIANGRATYFGYAATTETFSFTYNSQDATNGSFNILFRNAVSPDSLTNNSGAAATNKGGAPLALVYDGNNNFFFQSYDSAGNKTQLKNAQGNASGTTCSLANGEDRVIKIVTVEDSEAGTTAVSAYVDGNHIITSYADCIKKGGYITFVRYVANSPVTFSDICIDGVYHDPYYAVNGYTAGFEEGTNISVKGNASISDVMTHSGNYSILIDDSVSASGYFALGSRAQKSLVSDVTYRVTAWVRPADINASTNLEYNIYEAVSANTLNVQNEYRTSGIKVGYAYSTAMNEWGTCLGEDENGWRKILITKNYKLTEGKEEFSFPFIFTWSNAGGNGWYIDDIEFTPVVSAQAVSFNETMGSVSVHNNEYINVATKSSKDFLMAPLTNALGDSMTFTATANSGYRFVGWYNGNDLVSTKAVYTFTLTDEVKYTAKFEVYNSSYILQGFEDISLNIKPYESNPSYWNIDADSARNGEYGLHLDRVTYAESTMGFVSLFGEDSLSLESDKTYQISFWAKPVTVSKNDATLEFNFFAAPERNNASSGRSGQNHYNKKFTWNYNSIVKNAVEQDLDGWYKFVFEYEYKPTAELPFMTFTTWIPGNEEWHFDDFEFTQVCNASVTATDGGSAYISANEMFGGDEVTVLAVPNRGYIFEGWYENGKKIADASASYRFYASLDLHELEARFTGASPDYPTYSREDVLNGTAIAFLDGSIMREGNNAALAKALLRANAGQGLNVQIIGDAAATGIGATDYNHSFAGVLSSRLKDMYPCSYINVNTLGFEGASSRMLVGKTQDELSKNSPDIVIIDLASVDTGNDADAFETIIRTALKNNSAVLLMLSSYANTNEDGVTVSAQSTNVSELQIADYYDLTVLSFERALWSMIDGGSVSWQDVSFADNVYNNIGHRMFSSVLTYYLGLINDSAEDISSNQYDVPETYYFNDIYDGVNSFDASQIEPFANVGFSANGNTVCGMKAWEAVQTDAVITFSLKECKGFSLIYGSGIDAKGNLKVAVDGIEKLSVAVDNSGKPYVTDFIECYGEDVTVTVTASKGCRIAGINVGLSDTVSSNINEYRKQLATLSAFTYGKQEELIAVVSGKYETLSDYEKTLALDYSLVADVNDAIANLNGLDTEIVSIKSQVASADQNGMIRYKYFIDSKTETDYKSAGFTPVAAGSVTIPTVFINGGVLPEIGTALSVNRQFTRPQIGESGRFNVTVNNIVNDLRKATSITSVPYVIYRKGDIEVTVYTQAYSQNNAIEIAIENYKLATGESTIDGISALNWLAGR